MLENIKSIIFDFDGTIHETTKIYTPALTCGIKLLKEEGYIADLEVNDVYAGKFLGYSAKDAWKIIAPEAPKDIVERAMKIVGSKMDENMEKGKGELYPKAREVLKTLNDRGYDLYLLSNARVRYLELACKIYGIKNYFKKIIAAESYNFIPKDLILKDIIDNMEKEIIVVGDRFHDIDAARTNNLKSIFASYGYGKVEEGKKATYNIFNIGELIEN